MPAFVTNVPHQSVPFAASLSRAAWKATADLRLNWSVLKKEPATELTQVHIASDGKYIFVRFDAEQKEPVVATQRTDDIGQGNDDAVWVDLWPEGEKGFFYQFQATPIGTHYQSSSENAAYEPTWETHGAVTAHGYVVTMKIPLKAIRGAHSGAWNAQFVRLIHATGEIQVWSYNNLQTSPDDEARSGKLLLALSNKYRPLAHARIGAYALAMAASSTIGGSTSRVGADISLPLTRTSSFFATLHPDYSNIELDQQTIAPTIYGHYYSEVRPFFTQGAGLYNRVSYNATPSAIQPLYTPAIPTPSQGYAFEGIFGNESLAAFESLGPSRTDSASVLDYTSPDSRWLGSAQLVDVNAVGLHDSNSVVSVRYSDLSHVSAYLTYGSDAGTNVLTKSDAKWTDAGGAWESNTFFLGGGIRKLGNYYNPVDGYTFHPGIAGYGLYLVKIFDFPHNSPFVSAGMDATIGRYQGAVGGQNESDNELVFDLLTRRGVDLQLLSGSNYWRFGSQLRPVSQSSGFSVTFGSGLQTNNPRAFPGHGASSTATNVTLNEGTYGDGFLQSWFASTTIPLTRNMALALTSDETNQRFPTQAALVQRLDSVSLTAQLGSNSSFAVGLRQIIGMPPIPNAGGYCIGRCSNVSLVYHYQMRRAEWFFAYGDPNAATTAPQAIVKYIFYAGADKGT